MDLILDLLLEAAERDPAQQRVRPFFRWLVRGLFLAAVVYVWLVPADDELAVLIWTFRILFTVAFVPLVVRLALFRRGPNRLASRR